MITIEEFKDILEQHFAYDRKTMRDHEQGLLKLVICPILDTGYSDIFVLTNNQNSKWEKDSAIKQALITCKEANTRYYRAFVLFDANANQDDYDAGKTLPIWIISKKNNNEKHILQILDSTNIWEEFD